MLKNHRKPRIERHVWRSSLTLCFKQGSSQNYSRLLRASTSPALNALLLKNYLPSAQAGFSLLQFVPIALHSFLCSPPSRVWLCPPCKSPQLDASSPSSSSSLGWTSPVAPVPPCSRPLSPPCSCTGLFPVCWHLEAPTTTLHSC